MITLNGTTAFYSLKILNVKLFPSLVAKAEKAGVIATLKSHIQY